MSAPLHPSPAVLVKLAGIVHEVIHELPGSKADQLARDPEVIEWTRAMREIGLLPERTLP